ncbi:MAG TPA: hypothetical protein VGO85_21380 [Caldimonas sp.]|jgi:hypothetical protein|nr:hypothetical protein [Caldimonas sp.]
MKKDVILTPLLPFTSDEESALVERLGTMDAAALGHYVDCAQLALRNTALDPSWRPRVEIGLKHAEAAVVKEAAAAAIALEAAALVVPPPPAPTKAKKAEAA